MPLFTSNSNTLSSQLENDQMTIGHSSPFDSDDIPYREIPEKPWTKIFFYSFFILIIAMTGWEKLAIKMNHRAGTYENGFDYMWAEERSKLDKPNNIRIVLTGSSRVLWGFDLNIIEQIAGTRPLQLALPGTSPALFVKDIVDNTDFNGLMIVGVAPFLFNRLDEGFFGKGALHAYHNPSPSEISGNKIQSLLSEYLAFLDEAFSLPELMERYIRLPKRKGAKDLMAEQWKLGDIYQDRLTEMWHPVEIPGGFDNQQITNFWTPGLNRPIPKPEKIKDMSQSAIDYFRPLLKKLRARGGDMFFIRMPSSGKYLEFDQKSDYYNLMWKPFIKEMHVAGINAMDYPELSSKLDTPEWSHLNRESQDKFSAIIMDYINREYKKQMGKDLSTIIKNKDK